MRGNPRKDPNVKCVSWTQERKELEKLIENDINEIVLVENKFIVEGISSNIFVLENSDKPVLKTAPDNMVLKGTIRQIILEYAKKIDLEIKLECPSLDNSRDWIGAFISSTSRLVLPISEIKIDENKNVGFDEIHSKIIELRNLVNCLLMEKSKKVI